MAKMRGVAENTLLISHHTRSTSKPQVASAVDVRGASSNFVITRSPHHVASTSIGAVSSTLLLHHILKLLEVPEPMDTRMRQATLEILQTLANREASAAATCSSLGDLLQ
jgi:hypothetical protein